MTEEERRERKLAWKRKYRENNRALINARARIKGKLDRKADPERWRKKAREDYHRRKAVHAEKKRVRAKAWYHRNPERGKQNAKRYSQDHPELARARCAKRRAIQKRVSINTKGIYAWMKEVRTKPFARCHWCGTKVRGRKIHFDHITPLSKGGSHTIGNLCASCADCNRLKSNRDLAAWIVQGQSFLAL